MIITRYLSREILNALLAITLVLLLAILSQQIVRYLNYVAIGRIPTNVLFQLVSFEVPNLLTLLLPLGMYLGILIAYGRLYADNEMSILQMCGFGNGRLMQLTMFVAVLVSCVVLCLTMYLNPMISAKRQQLMESDEATLHLIETLIPGRFQVSPDGSHVMYVEKLSRDHARAENVFIAQAKKGAKESDPNAWMLVYANQGYQVKDTESADNFFVTADGYRYEGTPGQNDYKIIQFKKYSVRIPQNSVHVKHERIETLPTAQLWDDYEDTETAAELQWRISVPILAFILSLLAVPLSTVRPRQGRYLMLVPAALIYIIYINLLFISRHWIEYAVIPTALGMWWVHGMMLFFVGIALYFGSRQR